MDPSFQIRKLPAGVKGNLVKILEDAESWKRLMAIIPKTLQENTYECDTKKGNLPKYSSEHFRLIENGWLKYRRLCTDILLDEWGTSGRVLPTLGHLLHLLIKAELFRAADYIAIELLNQEPPPRPQNGPAAPVNIEMPPKTTHPLNNYNEFNKILDAIDYPSSAIDLIHGNVNELTHSDNAINVIPQIVISTTPDSETMDEEPTFTLPIPVQKRNTDEQANDVSDMMKFSSESNNVASGDNIPNFDLIYTPTNVPQNIHSDTTIQNSSSSDAFSNSMSESILPNLSAFQSKSEQYNNESESHFLPVVLNSYNSNKSKTSSTNCSRPCNSPLPNLSLNTVLPHFSYYELLTATNDFNNSQYTTESEMGRLLGSGAFGSVYLAVGLFEDRKVAVKKILLQNTEAVDVDDPVTKQFRNEVEVLCKYRHENLVSLIGYSCDGCTYCLVYEYVPGGALKDRLQESRKKLIWTERLYIALGTSRAVSYLHTAFSTPLIHRDIKSANILLDSNNKPKLCDFGLIKLIPNQNTNTSTTALGTRAYMAQEAFRGDISVKIDTFSFGVVLIELLSSLPPYDDNRQGYDLVTHIEHVCENEEIYTLLDTEAGNWTVNNVNFGCELFDIAMKCLEEKLKRPNMVDVTAMLEELLKRAN